MISKQVELDEKIVELEETMLDVYDLVINLDQEKQSAKSKIVERLVQQTHECAIFIREYCDTKTYCAALTIRVPGV